MKKYKSTPEVNPLHGVEGQIIIHRLSDENYQGGVKKTQTQVSNSRGVLVQKFIAAKKRQVK